MESKRILKKTDLKIAEEMAAKYFVSEQYRDRAYKMLLEMVDYKNKQIKTILKCWQGAIMHESEIINDL